MRGALRQLTALGLLGLAAGAGLAVEMVDGIAAQVGSDVVLVSEVEQLAAPLVRQMREAGAPDEEISRMRAEALERLIERRLIEQMARRAEIEASDAEVDEAITAIARENGLDAEGLRRSVEAQGLSYAAYRERIRAEIVQQKVLAGMVRPHVRVEEEEIQALYRERYADQETSGVELHVRHLLVTAEDAEARREACDRVRQARERILAGEPFERVAAELSEVNPERGGDLGWLHAGEIARWMQAVLESLDPGETSDVVETRFGCNLLQLVDRREVRPVSYEEARPQLRRELMDRKFEQEYRRFLEKLRTQTFIDRKGLYADAARLDFEGGDGPPERSLLP